MDKVEDFVLSSFRRSYDCSNPNNSVRPGLTLEDGQIYKHLLRVDISGDDFEVPVLLKDIVSNLRRNGYTEIVLPLYDDAYLTQRSMVGTMLQDFLRVDFRTRLTHIKDGRENHYYGCPGLVLGSDFKPLLMLNVKMHWYEEGATAGVTGCVCRISPEVMSMQDALIPKTIYKKIIPMLATTRITDVMLNWNLQRFAGLADIIMSTQTDNMVLTTVRPRVEDANDETFNRLIAQAADELE